MESKTHQPSGHITDISDAEWIIYKPMIYPADVKRGRGRLRHPDSARAALDAIRYKLTYGCKWSEMPKEFGPKSTVHDAYDKWNKQGLFQRIMEVLHTMKMQMQKNNTPSPPSSTANPPKTGHDRL